MHRKSKAKTEGQEIIRQAHTEGRNCLLEHEAKALFRIHGARIPAEYLAANADEAVEYAQKTGGAVVLKIVSPDILHKSDAKGVRINLKTEDEIRTAYNDIVKNAEKFDPQADIRGVLIAPMADSGTEVIIGTKIDDQFGPVIMFGIGGILVEIMKDVVFRVLPISPAAAGKMVKEIKAYPLLSGARGQAPLDQKALRKLLLLCSDLVDSYPEIKEMDLNPVIVYEKGISIVDARIILKD